MPNPKLRFAFHEPTVDTNLPLTDGTVKVEGFNLEVLPQGAEADARDAGFAALVQNKAKGADFVCIPAYSNRKFRLSYIFVNSEAGIDSPQDLAGKRVFAGGTASVWALGALQNYYEIDLNKVRWVTGSGRPPVPTAGAEALPQSADLDQLLIDGGLDCVIQPNVLPSISRGDPRTRRLFPEYKTEEQNYFKATGVFPISHVITLTREFVNDYPHAPVALLAAYRHARDEALERIEGSDPNILISSWVSYDLAQQRALMGPHYWPYNIEDNRVPLESTMVFSYQQGLSRAKLDYMSFFDQEAAALPGW